MSSNILLKFKTDKIDLMLKRILLTITLFSFVFLQKQVSAQTYQQEKINFYDSHIVINQDGSLTVTETINVYANGSAIKRGIYRDFPTDYKTKWSLNTGTTFEILEIRKNDLIEPYHNERLSNGTRVYIGDANIYLTPGVHTYKIKYKTEDQLGFFEGHDELYFNAIGTGWEFVIDSATANIVLPNGVEPNVTKIEGYTGKQGSKEQAVKTNIYKIEDNTTNAFLETTRPLLPNEGLTVVVTWPKGFVNEPTKQQMLLSLLKKNIPVFSGILVTFFVLGYYFVF